MKIKAILHPTPEGGYWAEVPALPGCITERDSLEEVINNLQEAITRWLAVANKKRWDKAHPNHFKMRAMPLDDDDDKPVLDLKCL